MAHNKIELLNFVMVLLSIALACVLPFDTFLFSYAVLGPLHYLTELHWLKQKDFFVSKTAVSIFVALSIIVTSVLFIIYLNLFDIKTGTLKGFVLLVFFMYCTYLVYTSKSKIKRILLLLTALLIGVLCFVKPSLIVVFGLFLPTIIHVYLFTAFFMIAGYLKSPNSYSLKSIILIILMPTIIYYLPLENLALSRISSENLYNSTGFKILNEWFVFFFGKSGIENSVLILKAQIFIAFAYTYHYLNWFSKTSIIGWAKTLELKKMVLVSVIWILSIVLYLYNYQTGLMVLFILSMIHVLAEFPLNVLSIKAIFQKWLKF